MAEISIVAIRLLERREFAGLSQTELGVAAGMDEGSCGIQICQYENGVHMPNIRLMTRLAAALNVPLPYFYCEDPLLADLILRYGALGSEQKIQLFGLMSASVETLPPPTPPQLKFGPSALEETQTEEVFNKDDPKDDAKDAPRDDPKD
jgi:transcriptional regulator with XRE-family HTH domain